MKKTNLISVPCRGTTFLNFSEMVRYSLISFWIISVPCRGTTFLNGKDHKGKYIYLNNFRPLSGNYISQFFRNGQVFAYIVLDNFRPLSGNYISQSQAIPLSDIPERSFPSPVGELHFSMVWSEMVRRL